MDKRNFAPHASADLEDRYPGAHLTEADKDRVRNATATIEELVSTDGLILFGLGEALSSILTTLLDTTAAVGGEHVALEVARQVGLRYGEDNYSKYLRNRGLESNAEVFCAYQDYMHTLRGPRHITAWWASHDDTSVLVERTDCLYFCGRRGVPNKLVAELELSITQGYRRVDPNLVIDNPQCLTKGDAAGCVHRFAFKEPAEHA